MTSPPKKTVFKFGFPMMRKELTRTKDGKFKYVYEDTLGRHWIANGPWDVLRVKAAFDMGGWYEASLSRKGGKADG